MDDAPGLFFLVTAEAENSIHDRSIINETHQYSEFSDNIYTIIASVPVNIIYYRNKEPWENDKFYENGEQVQEISRVG